MVWYGVTDGMVCIHGGIPGGRMHKYGVKYTLFAPFL